MTKAMRSEAEQLMGSARDMCRVEFSKTGVEPTKLSDALNALEDAFGGVYFSLRDKVYKKPDMSRGAIVAVPTEDDGRGWAALYFNYANGDSEIEWYASQRHGLSVVGMSLASANDGSPRDKRAVAFLGVLALTAAPECRGRGARPVARVFYRRM